jgi:hypothetical protein
MQAMRVFDHRARNVDNAAIKTGRTAQHRPSVSPEIPEAVRRRRRIDGRRRNRPMTQAIPGLPGSSDGGPLLSPLRHGLAVRSGRA